MTTKIFFMPYDPNHSGYLCALYEYGTAGGADMNKLQKDLDHEKEKGNDAFAVWYKPKTKNPFMSSFNTGHIYVRGHGMPGFRSIEGGRGGERITVKQLVDRMIESGLPKSFTGKIKLYNCHSAEDGKPGSDPECTGPAFARQVADEMYTRGYKSCTYYGYMGRIDSFVKDGSSGRHHYTRDMAGGKLVELGRASDARVQFHPKIKSTSLFQRLFG